MGLVGLDVTGGSFFQHLCALETPRLSLTCGGLGEALDERPCIAFSGL